MPSRSSGTPKVNRSIPVVRSIPTVAIRRPRQPPIKFFIGASPLIDASIESANTPRAKYSGGPKLYAILARRGAAKSSTNKLNIPPLTEETAAIPRARPASPFNAMG